MSVLRRVPNYVEQCKHKSRMNTASEPSDETPLHIIRRFTQYWRNDYVAVEQWSRNLIKGHYVALLELHRQHVLFAADWDIVLRLQGFAYAFERQQQTPRA